MTPLARAYVLAAALPIACGQPVGDSTSDADVSSGTSSGWLVTTSGSPTTTAAPGTSTTGEPGTTNVDTTGEPTTSTNTSTSSGDEPGTTTGELSTSTTSTSENVSGGSGTGCTLTCSPEFDQVLCDGGVVETCAAGSYCVEDTCQVLSACDAAGLLQRSEGCDFWAVKTEIHPEAQGACFAVFVANTGTAPAHLTVRHGDVVLPVNNFSRIPKGQGQDLAFVPYNNVAGLPVGEVAILFLSRGPGNYPNCPAGPAVAEETQIAGTGRGRAFHISSDVPVAAYQMQPFGGGSGAVTAASLLLPTSVWDHSYIAVNAGPAGPSGTPLLTFIARENDTNITLRPNAPVTPGKDVKGGPAGAPITYTLARGESLQINQSDELTGSTILADRPFALFGGSTGLNIPTNVYASDSAHQQIPPVRALGNAYAAVRYRDRVADKPESPPWRLVGAAKDTQLIWTPAKPPGAPDTLTLGQVADFTAPGPFHVRSQDEDHPFYAAAYMTGGQPFGGAGDPEWVNLVPPAQFQRRYIFFTDPTYPETELVVVRREEDGEFADVVLDCTGPLVAWKPLADGLEWTRVQLVTGNFSKVGKCANGRHEIASDKPFGVTVWGWGSAASQLVYTKFVSYAYPAGATIRSINTVEID